MFIVGYGFRPFMLIHTGCTSVSLLPVIFSGGDAQRSGYSCLPLRPPQMSLGLPFNQCRLYPHMNFGLAAQSWHDNLPTHSVTVVLLSPLGFPSRLAVDHRHETSRLPLAKRIYSAPYGRTNDMIVQVSFVNVCTYNTLIVWINLLHNFIPISLACSGVISSRISND